MESLSHTDGSSRFQSSAFASYEDEAQKNQSHREFGAVGQVLRVLVLEDHPLIAAQLALELDEQGHIVVGPYLSLAEAKASAAPFDAALLDVYIGREHSVALATALRQRGVPVILYSGAPPPQLMGNLLDIPWHSKPCSTAALIASLQNEAQRLHAELRFVRLLPRLRREARQLTGDQQRGDRLVAQVLSEALIYAKQNDTTDPSRWLFEQIRQKARDFMPSRLI